tara:strand:- start:136 stop:732 length:597 start_codon:yes stop_codon:yes gene_type:complete
MLLKFKSLKIVAGCDEAGRGCLAGPVFASAVILPNNFKCKRLDDSKRLSPKIRLKLKKHIMNESLAWSIGIVSEEEIDKLNILNASFLAMHRAIDNLKIDPELLIIDGNRFNKYKDIEHICIVKGDQKFMSIAAASIIAKTYRDDYMKKIDLEHPEYNWKSNKGYPTLEHRSSLVKYGLTKYHRKSFQLVNNQLNIDF